MAQLKSGNYYATITNVSLKEYKTSKNTKFTKVLVNVDIINDYELFKEYGKSPITSKTYYGNPEFMKDYFTQVGLTSATAIGVLVKVTLQKETFKNKDGEQINTTMIKYLNFLDDNKEVIISKKILEKQQENNKSKLKLDF